jgi:S1-C subfamily serine protease
LERALSSVVGLRATVPEDAFTAQTLGTERAGNGVVIREDGIVLTIGYLVTEAESLWLNTIDGRALPGHVAAYDQETGFGLVQALGRLNLPAVPLGQSAAVRIDDEVVVGGAGGRVRSLTAHVAAKQEFAGYWEYLLDEALFTAPAHPNWGGTAVLDAAGRLVGIGSLHLQQAGENGRTEHLNMNVPIDLLKPIYDDLLTLGHPNKPPRPWLGFYATEIEDRVVIAGFANDGPARRADLRVGDILLSVAGQEVGTLAALYRRIWSLGQAGVEVPITVQRDGQTVTVMPRSVDRAALLKRARMQ